MRHYFKWVCLFPLTISVYRQEVSREVGNSLDIASVQGPPYAMILRLMFKQIFRAGQRSCVEYCVRREGLGLRLLCVH